MSKVVKTKLEKKPVRKQLTFTSEAQFASLGMLARQKGFMNCSEYLRHLIAREFEKTDAFQVWEFSDEAAERIEKSYQDFLKDDKANPGKYKAYTSGEELVADLEKEIDEGI